MSKCAQKINFTQLLKLILKIQVCRHWHNYNIKFGMKIISPLKINVLQKKTYLFRYDNY